MTSPLPVVPGKMLPTVPHPGGLSWRARRNLAHQIDDLTAAGHVALVRELIASDLTRARVMSALSLCADATLQLLQANSMLHSVAKDPYEHALVTRNMAFAEATAQHIIAHAYA